MVLSRRENNYQLEILGHGASGLGILAQIYSHSHVESQRIKTNTNIVLKYGLRSLTTTPLITTYYLGSSSSSSSSSISSSVNTNHGDYYFLKSCLSCSKAFRSDQDIYMYRGDQGFCSKKCRSRQIMLDERREREESSKLTKKKMIPPTNCRGCETCRLLEDLRQRRRSRQNNNYKTKKQPVLSIS